MSRCSAALSFGRLKILGDVKDDISFYSKRYSYHSCPPRFSLFCPQKTHDFLESTKFSALCSLLQQKWHNLKPFRDEVAWTVLLFVFLKLEVHVYFHVYLLWKCFMVVDNSFSDSCRGNNGLYSYFYKVLITFSKLFILCCYFIK